MGCAADDEWVALAGLAVHIEGEAVLAFVDVLELEVPDFRDAAAGFPEDAHEGSVADVAAGCQDGFDVVGGEEFVSVESSSFAFFDVRVDPGHDGRWCLGWEVLGLHDPGEEAFEYALVRPEGLRGVRWSSLQHDRERMFDVRARHLIEVLVHVPSEEG